MSENTEKTIHREFELERMILFSDAVFAIAITLLAIEIKFPEIPENFKELDLGKLFKPTFKEFFGFIISFVLIGISWSRHLKMFRYLKAYDDRVVFLNLLSLLFIVIFPFTASGLAHFKEGFVLPYLIYIGNLSLMFFSNFVLAYYIFKKNPSLSVPEHAPEKNYIFLQNKLVSIAFASSFTIMLITAIITHFNYDYVLISFFSLPVFVAIARRKLKKIKPKKTVVYGT